MFNTKTVTESTPPTVAESMPAPARTPTRLGRKVPTYPLVALERVLDYGDRRKDHNPLVLQELAKLPLADKHGSVKLYGPFEWTPPPGWPHGHHHHVAAVMAEEHLDSWDKTWCLTIRHFPDLFTAHDRWTLAIEDEGKTLPVPGWPTSPAETGLCLGCGLPSLGWVHDSHCEARAAWWKTLPPVKHLAVVAQAVGPSTIERAPAPDPSEVGLAAAEHRAAVAIAGRAAAERDAATLRAELAQARAELEELRVADLRRRIHGAA